ncbi:PcfJ domain-containing protein [Paenibacillus odorifer]|uniref:PcfJ domain-containing protein n=1 Tax=Paenibacillus TaxID=44249 RepID=UPI00096C8858|nr:PcfJ domain-containing protein [Paenibacillus odorifer]OMC97116.1 hypothetical protein BJP46_26815 [Paenibacillus odorifer]
MEYKEFKAHFPVKHSQELENYVVNTVMLDSRYLFFNQRRGIQMAYCTHCQKNHVPEVKLKHKQISGATCPHCKSLCGVRASWISRKYMHDKGVFVWYEKSVLDPQAITAQVIHVYWEYSEDFKNVQRGIHCSDEYLFSAGSSAYFSYREQQKTTYSAFDRHFGGWSRWQRFISSENITKAVADTPFQYSTWEHYTRYQNQDYTSDMTEFFDLAARYPCVEYLTKTGFSSFVWAKLYKNHTWGAINWRGNSLSKVLRLSKSELKEVKRLGVEITPHQLRFYQTSRKAGGKLSISDAVVLAGVAEGYYEGIFSSFVKIASEEAVMKYILKQIRNGHYKTVTSMVSDWRDYRNECEQLRIDITVERYLFPNNLRVAHMNTSKKIKFKNDPKIELKIKKRLKSLSEFRFEQGDFILRPAISAEELFEEGALLGNCIGGYSKNYADGVTDLFLIRLATEPNTPYFAMEVSGGKVRQCRGFGNCEASPEVRKFVDAFVKEKLSKKMKKSKNPQGVAV